MVAYRGHPLALIACGDEATSRALEIIFQRHGYDSAQTRSGAQTIELARRLDHDVVVLDESIEDMQAVDVCRTLRDGLLFDHTVPMIITAPGGVDSATRLAAYGAGAWEYCSQPIDFEFVFLKLETFLRARREIVQARAEAFVNATTGLYTPFGLAQLAGKLGARAVRRQEAFACVAFSAEVTDREVGSTTSLGDSLSGFADVAHVFREQSRQSDIVGHMGDTRLAVLAPDTDAGGARLLVARLQRELDRTSKNKGSAEPIRLRAGISAVSNLAAANSSVPELVHRAESALDHIRWRAEAETVLDFDDLYPRR